MFIYNLLIIPIELIVQVTFYLMYKIFGENAGIAVVAVSLVVQTLLLPLYKRADAVQEEERRRQEKMAGWISHIRKTFKGEERFMMLQAYYREQDYRPLYALKGSVSMMLQIPFFIAAYRYLSNLSTLNGERFLFISDLGKPDAAISVAGFPVNILPIVMTVVNILSAIIYTKGFQVREKLQTYILAFIFLILLYNRPAGLLLYWTVNQIYSLVRNLIVRLAPVHLGNADNKGNIVLIGRYLEKIKPKQELQYKMYFIIAALDAMFIGGMISSNIVNSSAQEFLESGYVPLGIIANNCAVFIGIFVIWGGVFYLLTKERYRSLYIILLVIIFITGIVNYMFWGNNFGTMSELLVYEQGRYFSASAKMINLIIVAVIVLIVLIVTYKHIDWLYLPSCILLAVVVIFCGYNMISVQAQVNRANVGQENISDRKILNVSKNGHNVIFFMLDRAIDGYVPYIFEEKPEIKEAFEGFTWYPDTISFGACTNYASPALYGGYEYTPAEMNKRKDERLADKHDEALLVLPRIFSEAGYHVTVCDPPYAGYEWISDLSIYDRYENVDAYHVTGRYSGNSGNMSVYKKKLQSAFVYHSIMRALPVFCQNFIYKDGEYMSKYLPVTIDQKFLNAYAALKELKDLTNISEGSENNFLQLQNDVTHQPVFLKTPEYVPDESISGEITDWQAHYDENDKEINGNVLKMENADQIAHYQVNVAALAALGEWFDYLKENDCWDNTRIIVAADHGRNLAQFDNMMFRDGMDIELYNPLLLVKDFGDSEYRESDEFMTNADVSAIAVKDLIDDPVNPFTGIRLDRNYKSGEQSIVTSYNHAININNGNVFDTSDGHWYEVTPGNIFDENNWRITKDAVY